MLEISGICEKISFFISFFHSCPYLEVGVEGVGLVHELPRLRRVLEAAVGEPKLLMNSSSSPNFDELMNLFINN